MANGKFDRSRRDFSLRALSLGAALGAASTQSYAAEVRQAASRRSWQARLAAARRLFCIAYITPDAPGQGGQEAMVARFPLAIVGQGRRAVDLRWREKIRDLNPNIVMLGYQMTIEDTTVPGPGHDILRRITNAWTSLPDGSIFSVAVGSPDKMRRVFDPRKRAWRDGFVEACQATLASDPFEGLFLDQCTVFSGAHPDRSVREDMRAGIQEALAELRRREPNALIIANSSFTFGAVNGELIENRPRDFAAELRGSAAHSQPQIELAHVHVKSSADRAALRAHMRAAREHGAYFGASRDFQHVEWYEEFDSEWSMPKPPSKPVVEPA